MDQTYKSDTEHSAHADVSGEDVPSRVSRAAADILTVSQRKVIYLHVHAVLRVSD